MSVKRYAAKRDNSEQPIIEALRAVGAIVYPLSSEGLPDLLVCHYNRATNTYETALLECKTGRGKLTPAQEMFMETWLGDNVFIVRTVNEALHCIGASDIITDR